METLTDRRGTGVLLLASAVLSGAMYLVLGTSFEWPAILDEPAGVVLPAFAAAESTIRTGFWLMLLSSVLLVPAAFGINRVLGARGWIGSSIAAFGVAGAVVQTLGWVRWPVVVPYLSDAYAAAAEGPARDSIATSFDTLNLYAGGALGEHLGWLLQSIWALGVAVLAMRTSRRFGALGLALAVVWAVLVVGAVPLQYTETTLETVGLAVYTVWYIWLGALGAWLLFRRTTALALSVTG